MAATYKSQILKQFDWPRLAEEALVKNLRPSLAYPQTHPWTGRVYLGQVQDLFPHYSEALTETKKQENEAWFKALQEVATAFGGYCWAEVDFTKQELWFVREVPRIPVIRLGKFDPHTITLQWTCHNERWGLTFDPTKARRDYDMSPTCPVCHKSGLTYRMAFFGPKGK
jgi:hypothetical protein